MLPIPDDEEVGSADDDGDANLAELAKTGQLPNNGLLKDILNGGGASTFLER